jgi:16S rRNA U516 pseudouridylate synthase RsuA-like enzyme
MNEDAFNTSIRKFLKELGVTSQREIEKAVRQAVAEGRLKGNEKLATQATVVIGALKFSHEVTGTIDLG